MFCWSLHASKPLGVTLNANLKTTQGIAGAERHSRGNTRLAGGRLDGMFRCAATPAVPPTHCIHIEHTKLKYKALAFASRAGHGHPFAWQARVTCRHAYRCAMRCPTGGNALCPGSGEPHHADGSHGQETALHTPTRPWLQHACAAQPWSHLDSILPRQQRQPAGVPPQRGQQLPPRRPHASVVPTGPGPGPASSCLNLNRARVARQLPLAPHHCSAAAAAP
jgi:hypothetical protein